VETWRTGDGLVTVRLEVRSQDKLLAVDLV
jgi:hypothetical protein